MFDKDKLMLISCIAFFSKCAVYFFREDTHEDCTVYPEIYPDMQWNNPFLCDIDLLNRLFESAQDTPQIVWENQMVHYGIRKYDDVLCILGPVASVSANKSVTKEYMRNHRIHNVQNFYISRASSYKTLLLLSIVHYCLTGVYQMPQPVYSGFSKENTQEDSYRLLDYRMSNTEYGAQHIPYIAEQRLTNAIRNGNLEELQNIFSYNNSSEYSLGTMAHSDRKQMEYQAVITTSIACRAAIDGGLNPYDAYDMNDLYLQRISTANTTQQYFHISVEALITYCREVQRVKEQSSQSMHITKCKHFVAHHLNSPYHMQELADYVGLTPKYLGELFHSLEGQTLKSYILGERINAAKNMLKYSDYSLSQIGVYLCFDTQSHFSSTFRRFEGISPSEYRKRNKPLNF